MWFLLIYVFTFNASSFCDGNPFQRHLCENAMTLCFLIIHSKASKVEVSATDLSYFLLEIFKKCLLHSLRSMVISLHNVVIQIF